MKTVVITGSTRGFGLCQAKKFKELGYNVVVSGTSDANCDRALAELQGINPASTRAIKVLCNVTDAEQLQNLWDTAVAEFGAVDIWVNNAGVNSPDKPVYELTAHEIGFILDTDLKGTILGSKVAFAGMLKQGFGQIYNVEGYGSNDAMMTGLTLYGTAKRAVTYFTDSLSKESHDVAGDRIKVCKLTPGIMITDFIKTANGGATHIELPEKTKKIYNILGDYPETIADYVVPRMAANEKNGYNVVWLSSTRAASRFLLAGVRKRNFFE